MPGCSPAFWRTTLGYVDEPPPAPYATRAEWLAQFDLLEEFEGHHVVMADPEGNEFGVGVAASG